MKKEHWSYSIKKAAFILSVALFLVSLTQKCYCTTASCADSIMALISGAIGFVFGGAALTWLANPLLFASWFYNNRSPLISLILSLLSLIIMISFTFFKTIIADEAGSYKIIIAYKAGYWLWLSSGVVMTFNNIIYYFRPAKADDNMMV
jgi:uncharacterized membrane protein